MLKSVSQVFSSNLISRIILAITGLLLIRFLAREEFAIYVVIISVAQLVVQGLSIGLNQIQIINDGQDLKEVNESSFYSLSTFYVWLLCPIVLYFIEGSFSYAFELILLTWAFCILNVRQSAFRKMLEFKNYARIELIRSLLFFLAVLGLYLSYQEAVNARQILLVQSMSMMIPVLFTYLNHGFVKTLVGFFDLKKAIDFILQFIHNEYKWIFAFSLLSSALIQLDIVALKLFSGTHEVAAYGSSLRYYNFFTMLAFSFGLVYLPYFMNKEIKTDFGSVFKKQFKMGIVFTGVILFFVLFAHKLIPLIDNGKYPEAIWSFQVLCVNAIVLFFSVPFFHFLLKLKKFKSIFKIYVLFFIAMLIGHCILTPEFGIHAVVGITSIGLVGLNLSFMVFGWREYQRYA